MIALCQKCHRKYHDKYDDENTNAVTFAKFLKERSLQELHIMMSIYKTANNIPITDSVIDALEMESGGRK